MLKKLSQSTKAGEIRQRTNDLLDLKAMYDGLVDLLPALGLGREGVSYYAGSVIRSEIFQLARRTDPDRYLHVIAFIAHQLYRTAGQPGGHAADYPAVAPERLPA